MIEERERERERERDTAEQTLQNTVHFREGMQNLPYKDGIHSMCDGRGKFLLTLHRMVNERERERERKK